MMIIDELLIVFMIGAKKGQCLQKLVSVFIKCQVH